MHFVDGGSPGQYERKLPSTDFSCSVPANVEHSFMSVDGYSIGVLFPVVTMGFGLQSCSNCTYSKLT